MTTPSEAPMVIVFYHASCNDGFACAYLYWKINPTAEFVTIPAGKPVSDFHLRKITKETHVYCFDLTPPNILTLKERAKSILVIDHHKSALEILKSLPKEDYYFDLNHAACYLVWEWFFSNKRGSFEEANPSLLIQYIEDRDIWLKKMPFTEEVSMWLFTIQRTFENYKALDSEAAITTGIEIGKSILSYSNSLIESSARAAAIVLQEIGGKKYLIGYINNPQLRSDIGNVILKQHPKVDFSVVYYYDETAGTTNFSLRSEDTRTDVSEIAKLFGGGGHRNASGCDLNILSNRLPGKIFDTNKLYKILTAVNTVTAGTSGGGEDSEAIYLFLPDIDSIYTMQSYMFERFDSYKNYILVNHRMVDEKPSGTTCFTFIDKNLMEKYNQYPSKNNTIFREGVHRSLNKS